MLAPVYTQIHKIKRMFAVLMLASVAFLPLAGCETAPGSYAGSSAAPVDNPDNVPNIGWQTQTQRKEATAPTPATTAAPVPAAKITVALLVPLSGKNAEMGLSMMNAAQMALFDVGSDAITLQPQDTSAGAAAAAQKAISGGAKILLGPIFAEDVKAVKPLADQAGIPMLAFTTDWTLAGGNTYLLSFLPQSQVARIAQYTKSQGYNHIAALAPTTPYADIVVSSLQKSGARISKIARYGLSQADMQKTVDSFVSESKIPNSAGKPSLTFDALMLPAGGEGLSSVVAALDKAGVNKANSKFIGTGLWDDTALASNPALYGSWFAAPEPTARRDFEKRYHDNYGSTPPRLSSLSYDAMALASVLARSTPAGENPYTRGNLTAPRGFAGIDGIFRFNNDNLSDRGLAVLEIQAGKPRVIDPAPKNF